MFEFFKIDKELTVYRKNDVIIFGASGAGIRVKHFLEQHEVKIVAFVDNNVNKVGKDIEGIKIISVDECVEHVQNQPTVIQIGSTYEKEIAEQLKSRGVDCYIWYTEFLNRVRTLNKYIFFQQSPETNKIFDEMERKYNIATRDEKSVAIIIQEYQYTNIARLMLSAPKTGNDTIQQSVKAGGWNILPIIHDHTRINRDIQKFLNQLAHTKLIIGVREPIKQNISLMYELLNAKMETGQCAYYDVDAYWRGGGDVKAIFNECIIKCEKDCRYTEVKKKAQSDHLVQHFFEQEIEPFLGIDIYQYSFDKKNGYSIYHIHDRLDIMVYQLEKLNSLEAEIGDFLEIENFKLVKSNDSEDKWYRESYQNVVKNMPIDKQYYEECYSSKYINHFYSTEDIDKFKAQWKVE